MRNRFDDSNELTIKHQQIDSARMYVGGKTEELLGDVMGEEKSIASLRVASKVRIVISHFSRIVLSHTHTHTGKSMVRRSLSSWSEKTIGGFSESAQE